MVDTSGPERITMGQGRPGRGQPVGMGRALLVDGDRQRAGRIISHVSKTIGSAWRLDRAATVDEAIAILAERHCDVVIGGPGMDRAEMVMLFGEMRHTYPDTVRMAYCPAACEQVPKWISDAHQCLGSAADGVELAARLERVSALAKLVPAPGLRRMAMRVNSLPCLAASKRRLIVQLDRPDPSVMEVAQTIAGDVGMAAKAVQLAYSRACADCENVIGPAEAVARMGMDTVKSLVMSCNVFEQLSPSAVPGSWLAELNAHSRAVAASAAEIAATDTGPQRVVSHSRVGGLLHDIGKLLLASAMPERYADMLERAGRSGASISDVEAEELGADHGRIGAYLVGLWGLPAVVVDTIANHHQLSVAADQPFGAAAAICAANALVRLGEVDADVKSLPGWLAADGRLPAWRATCMDAARAASRAAAMPH